MPELYCGGGGTTWTPGLVDVQQSGYWPATIQSSVLYDCEVFKAFEDFKLASPGSSRLAMVKMLNMKTTSYGRVSA